MPSARMWALWEESSIMEIKTIQHAGVVIGLGAHRTAGHTHYRQKRENLGYMGRLCYAQDVSAVTGACLMVKKALYEEAGGLDEGFAVSPERCGLLPEAAGNGVSECIYSLLRNFIIMSRYPEA